MTNTKDNVPEVKSYEAKFKENIETLEGLYSKEKLQFPMKEVVIREFTEEIRPLYVQKDGLLGVISGNGLDEPRTHFYKTLKNLADEDPKFASAAFANIHHLYMVGDLKIVDQWVGEALLQDNYSKITEEYQDVVNKRENLDFKIKMAEELLKDSEETDANIIASAQKEIDNHKLELENYDTKLIPDAEKKYHSAVSKSKKSIINFLNFGEEGRKVYVNLRNEYVIGQRKKVAVGYTIAGVAGITALVLAGTTYFVNSDKNKALEENNHLAKENSSLKIVSKDKSVERKDLSDKLAREEQISAGLQIELDTSKEALTECNGNAEKEKKVSDQTKTDYDSCVSERDTLYNKCGSKQVICKDKSQWKRRRVKTKSPDTAPVQQSQKPRRRIY